MASLLERMNIDSSVGPVRSKPRRSDPAPYSRPSKADVNSTWQHDMFNDGKGKSLSARLGPGAPRKINAGMAVRATQEAAGLVGAGSRGGELSIRGASSKGNVVDVSGLVRGTTAEDVEAIFKRCGPITQSSAKNSPDGGVTVRLTFKNDKDARASVESFNGQVADGRTLAVRIVGGVNATLSGRLSVGAQDGTVDDLLAGAPTSKMRSDDILNDSEARARAHVLVAPPGADPREYTQQTRGSGGRGRGGRGRRGRRGAARMDVD
ncbi:hypothetical protein DENSPDRAFT_836460 [Dentipellis sp. KUC8613]|nr:hypothetical protein DENSPDRAFT_836460 [Dentipellis sp. KUC8613]